MDSLHLALIALAIATGLGVLVVWILTPSRRPHGGSAPPASRPPRQDGAWDGAASRRRELA
jgi:hypothetical protein